MVAGHASVARPWISHIRLNGKEGMRVMGQCVLCGGTAYPFGGIRVRDGRICGQCASGLPGMVRHEAGKMDGGEINAVAVYLAGKDARRFEPTASFGTLRIDELHGLFTVADGSRGGIFHCLDMSETGLAVTNIRYNAGRRRVCCDFEFSFTLDRPSFTYRGIVKKGAVCDTRRTSPTELSYSLPGDYHIFIEVFNQMLRTARAGHERGTAPAFASKPAFDLFKAETLFMLSDGYDSDEIERQRERLLSAFGGDPAYAGIIEHAYSILICGIREARGL